MSAPDASPLFSALADPTRRTILETLSSKGSTTATELAGDLAISRQAVAKHLDVLHDAGLAQARREGREKRYRPSLDALGAVAEWVASVQGEWQARLGLMARSLDTPDTADTSDS